MKAAAAADGGPTDQKANELEEAYGSKRKHSSHHEELSDRKKRKTKKHKQDEQV